MNRFTLLAAALVCLATGSFAQGTPWFDIMAKGTGIAANKDLGGNFELLAVSAGGQLTGAFIFKQNYPQTTTPVVVSIDTALTLTLDTNTAEFDGTGKLNGVAAKIHVEAVDNGMGGRSSKPDMLTVAAEAEDGTTFSFTGNVGPGDICVQGGTPPPPPPPPSQIFGHGVIQISDTNVGVLDVKAVLNGTRIDGGFMYSELAKGQRMPVHMVMCKKISDMTVVGNVGTIKADVEFDKQVATATLVVTDNRKPTDSGGTPDTFELHVFVNGTEVYTASGPLVNGDLVVK